MVTRVWFFRLLVAVQLVWGSWFVPCAFGGMMGDLPEGVLQKPKDIHTFDYTRLPTFSIYGKDGKLLVDRAYDIKMAPFKGTFYSRGGKRGFLETEDIHLEPEPPHGQCKIGPRK